MDLKLNGKRALVTGGSKGIGKSISELLKKEGVDVTVLSRTEGLKIDVLTDNLSSVPNNFDILINNVGGGGTWGSEEYESFNEWDEVYKKNAGVATKLTMKCLPYMKKKKWGRVITISSMYGKESGGKPWFVMAKSAEIALMKSLSGKYEGITFNTIAPGYIDVGKDFGNISEKAKIGSPEDVANLVVFLCSDKANFINGACISIDGGESKSF